MRHRKRRDANTEDIDKVCAWLGIVSCNLEDVGDGVPDKLWAFPASRHSGPYGINVLVEIKDGTKAPSRRRLTNAQQQFHRSWPGPIEVVCGPLDVLALYERYTGQKPNIWQRKLTGDMA